MARKGLGEVQWFAEGEERVKSKADIIYEQLISLHR